jgi:hypothetical protein
LPQVAQNRVEQDGSTGPVCLQLLSLPGRVSVRKGCRAHLEQNPFLQLLQDCLPASQPVGSLPPGSTVPLGNQQNLPCYFKSPSYVCSLVSLCSMGAGCPDLTGTSAPSQGLAARPSQRVTLGTPTSRDGSQQRAATHLWPLLRSDLCALWDPHRESYTYQTQAAQLSHPFPAAS